MSITTSYIPRKGLQASSLKIHFKDFKYNIAYLNSLRRILIEYVPTYAFDRELIKISKNTGYQNNDQISLRLSQIPVLGINTDLIYIEDYRWQNVDYTKNEEDFPEEKTYEVSINVKNTTHDYLAVTTNNFSVFINGQQIKNPYDQANPLLITILRKDEELICNMTAKIRLGILNTCWSPVYNTYCMYKGNDYDFIIHSYGQQTEQKLFNQGIEVILYRLKLFKSLIDNIKEKDITEYNININDKSISNILVATLQKYDEVEFVGSNIKSFLEPKVVLHLIVKEKTDIKKLFAKCIDEITKNYTEIKNEFNKNSK